MKKQFFRVKQLADQTFSRAGKTNALSDDLQDADRKTEYIKNACQIVAKKLPACSLLGSSASDATMPFKDRKEKALKKSAEYALALALKECSTSCDDDSSLRIFLEACAAFEQQIVDDNIDRDALIETNVVAHFQAFLENEIPSISKQKRNVLKLCLDMDSAKARYSQASKHSGGTPAGMAKAESVKEELDDCEMKLEQSRDQLACEMFQFIVHESAMCGHLLDFYKYRRAYYQNALTQLDSLIPRLETVATDSTVSKVYGTRLEDHLRVTGRRIAYPIELFVCALLELGMDEEGLFRLTGGASKVKRMKLSVDAGCMTLATALTYRDPHIISGCLKSYLRDLPEPLLTFALYDEWLDAVKTTGSETKRLELLRQVIQKLPTAQYDNLRYLIWFFHSLSRNQEVNKMTPQNLAIVLAPNLIWLGEDNSGISINALNATSHYARIVELLVSHCDTLFPGDIEFYVTLEPVANGGDDGFDNRGFDPRAPESNLKRSQSVNSLSDEPLGSPKPVMRKKNKPVAPTPPIEKPPRPTAVAVGATTISTLPRPGKSNASTNTEEIMTRSVDGVIETSSPPEMRKKNDEKIKVSTGTSPRQDMRSAKEIWLQSKPAIPERPVIPERPAALKPTPKLRSSIVDKNYENVSMSSTENLSGDERTLQRTQIYSIDKQQIAIIQVNEMKRERSREKRSKERDKEITEPDTNQNDNKTEEDDVESKMVESKRPCSISGMTDKPERPPKPDHFVSPSHTRTFSDGQIIDKREIKAKRDMNSNEGMKSLVKHPATSPPPPPVPAKPRTPSQDESTDF